MIRIVTGRNPDGIPTGWDEFEAVQIDEVTPLMGLRFDRELAELDALGVSLGVVRWTEAEFRIRRFSGEAIERLAAIQQRVAGAPEVSRAEVVRAQREEFATWLARHPAFELSKRVAIWAAVNSAGRPMSLLEVLTLPPRDVEEIDDGPDFIEDAAAAEVAEAGKA